MVGLRVPVKNYDFHEKKVNQTHYTREKVKKSDGFAWEVCTSMSPRCSEMSTCFEKLQMSLTFSMVLRPLKAAEKVSQIVGTRKNLQKNCNSVWEV